ncbi:3-carboxyethylcatechol 2,3-dioxygenase [Streptomyces sp. NPDC052023]|uniref:3-carboxyethylcatechol 2,3-dioxygenase n=1 Tax=Streptomyces sp. NPDC052023 TaxID=3365681 RepID=UPI0037D6D373
MPLALIAMSHSPLLTSHRPAEHIVEEVGWAFDGARRFAAGFAPDLVIVFSPDHYNGMFYRLMPPFCIGAAARSIGDYDTPAGPLSVDREAARALTERVLADGVDIALSERMDVDHGFTQPLQILFGSIDSIPVVPVFINAIATPLCPLSRIRRLGEALGGAAEATGRRVLLVASGGLSHDPPMPRLDGADEQVAERIVAGGDLPADQRADRERKARLAAREFAAGRPVMRPLNPQWDRALLSVLTSGDLRRLDAWSNDRMTEQAGSSAHEVRTWIAAYAALSAQGPYAVTASYYRPIPEWIAGFAVTTALPRHAATAVR